MSEALDNLYKSRKQMIDEGYEWDSPELLGIESKIEQIEELYSLEEVLNRIESGQMKSIFTP